MSLTSEAQFLLNNEAFRQAMESAQKEYINAAMACGLKDDEGRRLHLSAARIVGTIANHIATLAATQAGEVPEIPDFYEERAKRRFAFFSK